MHVEVADTGIGMDPQELAHIYEEFYQIGVPTNASREGYGLGLSIVSRIIKLLDLKLDVRSELGKGSTFSLALPAGTPIVSQEGLQGAAESTKDTKSAHHILVVEDEPAVLNATRLLLKAEGYRVATATTVAEAVGRIRESSDLDLLLTDYHLADGETGKEVISSVRAGRFTLERGKSASSQGIMIQTAADSSARRETCAPMTLSVQCTRSLAISRATAACSIFGMFARSNPRKLGPLTTTSRS